MKLKSIIILLLFFSALISCEKDEYEIVNGATAEYMFLEAFRSSVKITAPIPIVESGKIYVYNNLGLINDVDKGIHIINNSGPEHPFEKAFIKIIAN